MRFDFAVDLQNEGGETRRQNYSDASHDQEQLEELVALAKSAILDAVAATGDMSWKLDSIICEPVSDGVLEEAA